MQSQEIDYKNTVNLPQTSFSMKANLSQKEPVILRKWEELDIYKKIIERSKTKQKFILHDGPPYANGNIHIGHALNKILKDIIIKYKTMSGFQSPYVPGWDCHGLPVEHQLFRELGCRKDEVKQVAFRKKAHDFAMKFVNIQRDEFKRLGVFGDWENPYLTLSHNYEAVIIRSFGVLVGKGYVYKGYKPVNWCYSCETALAEAEVEYENYTSPSIYVKFEIVNPEKLNIPDYNQKKKVYILIWTTTPWTLLGNVACAVHPDFSYIVIDTKSEYLIMEKNLANLILEKSNITSYNFADEKKGLKLNHIIYRHPFGLRAGIIVMADYVASDEGTGVVHTAPGYGTEDFYTGKKYKLDIVMQVDNQGCFYKDIPEFGGLHVRQANSAIIEKLNTLGLLLHKGEIIHSYPHCWRCKNAIIFRATEQWFMHIDHNELRKRTLTAIKKVAWFPKFGENRIASMVENRPDWCLSRQRLWGVPIPVFYCKQCNFAILDKGLIDNFAKIVEKEGTDSWFISSIEDLLPTGYLCPKCKKKDFIQEKDILDVWFDSGVSAQAVLKANKDLAYPADLYLEGSDQHRGWFQAALLPAMAIDDFSPFKAVLTHGFVVDGEGKKMSKSLGNVIAPQEVIAKLGADVLRLWVAFSDYNDDVRISDEILNRISEGYRKIRNTLKFMLGNLFDFDPEKDSIAYSELMEIDRWALSVLHSLRAQVKIAYDNYVFHQAVKLIYNFCVVQMSSFYLDVLKDRLYTFTKKSKARRSAQTAIYQILLTITKMIAPILSFTAEEAYSLSCGQKEESIFLTQWPTADKTFIDIKLERTWNLLLDTRNFVLKELEIARSNKIIGNSLEAKVIIFYSESNPEIAALLKKHHQQLASIFLTSQVQLKVDIDRQELPIYNISLLKDKMSTTTAPIKIKIERAEGNKCIRCWNYSLSVGEDDKHRNLCARCISNLAGKE